MVLGAAAAIWLIIWLLGLRPPRSPEETVRDAIVAFGNRDANAIYDLMSEEEKEKSDITRESFSKFFDEYVEPKLSGFVATGDPKIIQLGAADNDVSSNQVLAHNDGRKIGIGFSARPAGREDAKLRGVIVTLFMACMISEFPPGPLPSANGAVLKGWASTIERDAKLLTDTGVTRVWRMRDSEADGPQTWDDWAKDLRLTIAKNYTD